nr:immunoglobulin heavy chain junction region [Macaca mulatta]
YSNGVTSLDVW